VLVVYGILLVVSPEGARTAARSSVHVFRNVVVPLCLVFLVMVILNLFLKPGQVSRFLGKGSGIKGVLLSATAGVISMGPIYAWYPMLKQLKEKGAGNSSLAIFLGNRAVKPFLLPVMISYFGWFFVLILTVLTVFGSVLVGVLVGAFVRDFGE
jgi:uncharacterized membrane protein YraQ (UPF0718 family)